jgi:hypothetical protein
MKCFIDQRDYLNSTHYMLKDFETSMSIELDGLQFAYCAWHYSSFHYTIKSNLVSNYLSHLELNCNMLHVLPFAEASATFGAKGRPAQPKSPRHPSYIDGSIRAHGVNNQCAVAHIPSNWCIERHDADSRSGLKFDMPSSHHQALEDLEMEFKREASELVKARDQEEDEENHRHREVMCFFFCTINSV